MAKTAKKAPAKPKAKAAKASRRGRRHWKTKMWKRRTLVRQARAAAFRLAGE